MNGLYIIKHNSNEFKDNTIVKFITCSYSGDCYLIEEPNSNKREWIMYYDLYPIDWDNHPFKYKWYYSEKFENIIKGIMNK
jgi:hypothetical protein